MMESVGMETHFNESDALANSRVAQTNGTFKPQRCVLGHLHDILLLDVMIGCRGQLTRSTGLSAAT